jgi:hypothetical protein
MTQISKPMHAFDSDAHAAIQHLKSHSQSTGKVRKRILDKRLKDN